MNYIDKYSQYIVIVLLLIIMFRTCGVGSDVNRINKNNIKLEQKIDSTANLIITKDQMIKLIHETPNWTTLEIEELSDKNKIPINFYKNKGIEK
jgi:hypothetical protein